MTKILITGSNGLLGQKLIYALRSRNDITLIATAKGVNRTKEKSGYVYEELDITNPEMVMNVLMSHNPDCVINTAAMTNVDACEQNKAECRKLNVDAVTYLTNACKKTNAHFIHLSTDFVFDGENGPYKEDDKTNPLSFYAQSKLDSEKIVEQNSLAWTIIRTIIIYGVVDDLQRSNVVLWTINSLRDKKKISVISDQQRSPTLAEDLADACIQAAIKKQTGLYHVSGKNIMTILESVQQTADFFGLDKSFIKPITTAELNQAAKRPLKTGFIIDKAIKDLNYQPHSFAEGLAVVKKQLEKNKNAYKK
ncbi:MAG TPA: SDR family oxidoreductase [Bacteroidia bacterium]|nr:SDR family oxidoreductase [Bacteroidia bacterium]HNU32364.1 SDR family oxidoreductase [Bacteroidia bacterium]